MTDRPKHTPGPWALDKDPVTDAYLLRGAGNSLVAYTSDDEEEREHANARLIAAAPDLLEALTRISTTTVRCAALSADQLREIARAAIAKATGADREALSDA